MEILDKLITLRKEKKVRQNEIASALRISAATLSKYENGRSEMGLGVAEAYAEYLGYELRLLIK